MIDGATNTEFDESRLKGTARIVLICAIAWGLFGLYYVFLQRNEAGVHCLIQGIIGAMLALVLRYKPKYNHQVAQLYVGCLVLGLTYDSFANGMERSVSPMFYSCGVLVAALTVGRRGTYFWIGISMVLILVVNYILPPFLPARPSATLLDKTLAYIALLGVVGFCALVADSTTRAYAQQLERSVGIDVLTGLQNRRRFRADAARLLDVNESKSLAVLLIDVNDFKPINDRLGHEVGDYVLRNVGERLKDSVGGIGSAYRLGGDEFVAVVAADSYEAARTSAYEVADTFTTAMKAPIQGNQAAPCFAISASVGIAVYPEHAQSIDELLSCADKAMYASKAQSEPVTLFEPQMLDEAMRILNLKSQLESAIENDEFALVYQPQVGLASNRIVGVEALLRWNFSGNLMTPDAFTSCLEETGRIVEVGSWVVRSACEQLWRWQNMGIETQVSVNISSLQMQDFRFAEFVMESLDEFGLKGQQLDIEITETLFLKRNAVTRKNMEQLALRGVTFSIDDFGTGYSSLAYLKQLPLDRLKIDKSFICDIPTSDDGVIAATVITLAKQLGMRVIAEGVETEEQLSFLKQHVCDEYQGYLYSKPVTAGEITELFATEVKESNRESDLLSDASAVNRGTS